MPWLCVIGQDCPTSEKRRRFGVTRVSQVGTFVPVSHWSTMDENRCNITNYRVQGSASGSTSRDLKSAQCRFESDWGHVSPCGSRFLDQDSGFRVVAWTSVAFHVSEWTTEAADFRSASDGMPSDSTYSHLCSSGSVSLLNSRLRAWLGVTWLSQLDLAELSDLTNARDPVRATHRGACDETEVAHEHLPLERRPLTSTPPTQPRGGMDMRCGSCRGNGPLLTSKVPE